MIAHVAGVPLEESLSWLVPVAGLGIAGSLSWVRLRLSTARGEGGGN